MDEKGIDRKTGKVLVEVDPKYFRPTEVEQLLGDPTKVARYIYLTSFLHFSLFSASFIQLLHKPHIMLHHNTHQLFERSFLAAAYVGGIMANSIYRADFIYRNLQIQQNVIGECYRHGVKKLLFLGSTCIYPSPFLTLLRFFYTTSSQTAYHAPP